jgi:hypothetical protein
VHCGSFPHAGGCARGSACGSSPFYDCATHLPGPPLTLTLSPTYGGEGTGRYFTSTSPASMYCPPLIWWQWIAIVFFPGFSAFCASGEIGISPYPVV